MNRNKFLALTMAGAMTLAAATPVFAENKTGTTTVSLVVAAPAPTNEYTMTVAAKTALDSEGAVTELTGGIKITDGDLEEGKKLTVTAESQNDWTLKADGVTTGIGYALYSDEAAETEATSWEFTQAEAKEGATKAVYAKADATDVADAAAGTYSDTITFTAAVEDAVTGVTFTIDGASYTVDEGTTWAQFIEGAGKDVVMVYSGSYVARKNPYSMLMYNGSVVAVGEKIQNGGVYTKAY